MKVEAPQHELPPVPTRRAAAAYFSFTISLIPDSLINAPICKFGRFCFAVPPGYGCSTRRRESPAIPARFRCSRCNARKCFRVAHGPNLRFSICPDGATGLSWEFLVHLEFRQPPNLGDGPTRATA